jgi:hypothetical protein
MFAENLIQFSEAQNKSTTASKSTYTYHCAGIATSDSGKSTWIDGIIHVNSMILNQSDYLGVKNLLSAQYHLLSENVVITSLSRLDGAL